MSDKELNTAQLLVRRLLLWGVEVVFGLPGDGINGIMEALREERERIGFIQVRHEEAAAFAACAYSKFSGRIGVCLATSGPGAIHLLNGLYDAKLDRVPVLAITGMQYHDLIGTHYQQDINTDYAFQDVAVHNQRVMGPAHVENLVDTGIRTALTHRGVAHITIPNDTQLERLKQDQRSPRNLPGHTGGHYVPPVTVPTQPDLERAAEVLRGCQRPVILAGSGARGARAELEAIAEKLGAPIVKPLLGKDVVPDDSPYTTGGIGLLGTRPSTVALEECDGLLIAGSSFPYTEYWPTPGQAKAVQIDSDASRIGMRYPVNAALCGDAPATLRALLPLLSPNDDRSFLKEAQDGYQEWLKLMDERATGEDFPMRSDRLAREISRLLDDDAIIIADTGTVTAAAARQVFIRGEQRFSASGTLASMANGVPYAIAAQAAHPGRQVVALVGDGGMSMLMGELATAAAHRLPIKVVVFKNNSLGMIKWEQMIFLGNPEYGCELYPVDFVKVAEACGVKGLRVEQPAECAATIREALATDGPVLVEAAVDPYEPPLPPKVKPGEAKNLALALARGEPNRERIGVTLFRNTVPETAFPASPAGLPARIAEKVGGILPGSSNGEDPKS